MADATGRRILVVEDDSLMAEIVERILQQEGWRPIFAADGREALTRLREERFDAVLLDVFLPHLDGIGVVRAMRAEPSLQAVPVLMMSGNAEEPEVVEALSAGASDFVSKPIRPRELAVRLARLVAK